MGKIFVRAGRVLMVLGVVAGCGSDPVAGTWKLTKSDANFSAYAVTLVFSSGSVTVDIEATRTASSAMMPGCNESTTGSGSYQVSGSTLTSNFTSGNFSSRDCPNASDNISGPLGAAAGVLNLVASGTYQLTGNTLTLTMAVQGGTTVIVYTRA